MANARAVAAAVEVLGIPTPTARAAAVAVEVLASDPQPQARIASSCVEVLSARPVASSTMSRGDIVFVAVIDRAVDSDGTIETLYVTDGPGWRTGPADTPANTPIRSTLKNPGTFRREMFSGNRVTGAVRPAFGEAVLANFDGAYDSIKDDGFDGRAYQVFAGRHGYPFPGSGADAFIPVFKCTMERVIVDFDTVRIRLTDRLNLLERSVLTQSFAGTGGLEGAAEMAGRPKPRMFGDPLYVPVVPIIQQAPVVRYQTTGPTYDLAASYEGTIPASEVLMRYRFPRDVTFVAGLAPSTGTSDVAATASKTFAIQRNGVDVGSFTFAAGDAVAVFLMTTDTTFVVDDVLTVVAPSTADATLASIAFTLSGFPQ